MYSKLKKTTQIFRSLKLTVALLFFSIVLLFLGTLDQVSFGVAYMLDHYIESFFTLWTYNQWLPYSNYLSWIKIPLLGGYSVGILLLINLLFGHLRKISFSIKNTGLLFVHSGIAFILISQGLTQAYREEFLLKLSTGQTVRFESQEKESSLDASEFSIQLNHFDREFYPQSEILKGISSSITLKSDHTEMDASIRMNEPFRWGWYTFYQSSHVSDQKSCYIQVVYNPVESFPYIATTIILLGFLILFGQHLIRYQKRRETGE